MSRYGHYKLGKAPAKHDPRTLRLSSYTTPQLPPPPVEQRWSPAVAAAAGGEGAWPMYRNDQIGNCAIVTTAHATKCWTANADGPQRAVEPTLEEVVAEYSAVSGFDPRTGANDTGCVVLDVLKRWRNTGLFGRKIAGYIAVDFHDHTTIKQAMAMFGGLYAGVQLPLAAQDMEDWLAPTPGSRLGIRQRRLWAKGSWGGHAIYLADYGQSFVMAPTWGAPKRISWNFIRQFLDELWAVVSEDWTNDAGRAPNGFDLPKLLADLQKVSRPSA